MAKLALVRHGQSEWNEKGLWTGHQDIALTVKGRQEARQAALTLKNVGFHMGFTSDLIRAVDTLEEMTVVLSLADFPVVKHKALKERHYGVFTGKNKWQIKKEVGEEKFMKIRRGWDEKIEKGETLKDVFKRVVPYFIREILPRLCQGKNILLVAHGNSIRALVKHLENIPDEDISRIELETGEIIIYELDKKGKVINKEKRRN